LVLVRVQLGQKGGLEIGIVPLVQRSARGAEK
jgi:hypothetical protein